MIMNFALYFIQKRIISNLIVSIVIFYICSVIIIGPLAELV